MKPGGVVLGADPLAHVVPSGSPSSATLALASAAAPVSSILPQRLRAPTGHGFGPYGSCKESSLPGCPASPARLPDGEGRLRLPA